MTLGFPNPSRSFDEARNAIRFIGHDGMFEVPFYIEVDALPGPVANSGTSAALEATCLAAFDAARGPIHDVASEAYAKGRRTSYTLTTADFR